MNIEAIAPQGLHEKVLELTSTLPGSVYLDAPAGYGALTQKLLQRGHDVIAVDIDTDRLAVPPHSRLRTLRHDLNSEQFPVPDESVDVALSVEGIEHLQCQWNLVRSLHRVLRPGGYLVITTPNILNFRSRVRYFLEGRYEHFKRPLVNGRSWEHDLQNYHIAPVSYFELQFMLESEGFEIRSLDTNRHASRNFISILLRPLFSFVYRFKNFRDERRGRGSHLPLYELILSDAIYYGECLIVLARKPPVEPCH